MTVIPRIASFSGEYEFLSNFYAAPIKVNGILFSTLEHAYQATKSRNMEDWKKIASLKTPGQAKREGQKLALRDDWERIKIEVMRILLFEKFLSHPDLAERLIATGEAELVEGNTWGDTYWGVCDGKGLNMLGKLLMDLRKELS